MSAFWFSLGLLWIGVTAARAAVDEAVRVAVAVRRWRAARRITHRIGAGVPA